MAFDRQNLTRVGGANSNSKALWIYYSSADNAAAIVAADYFLDAITELKLGDSLIFEDSGAVHKVSYIKANTGTSITAATGVTMTA